MNFLNLYKLEKKQNLIVNTITESNLPAVRETRREIRANSSAYPFGTLSDEIGFLRQNTFTDNMITSLSARVVFQYVVVVSVAEVRACILNHFERHDESILGSKP